VGWRDNWGEGMSLGLVSAWHFALSCAHQETGGRVESRHLAWSMVVAGGVARQVLRSLGVDTDSLLEELRPAVDVPKPGTAGDPLKLVPVVAALAVPEGVDVSADADAVLELAAEEATDHFGTAHLLLGLLRHGVPELSTITVDMARAAIRRQMTGFLSGRVPPMNPARADDLISTPRERLPDELREVIARMRDLYREKELAIDAGDYERAQRVRDELKDAIRVKREREAEWRPKVDVVSVVDEVETLRAEVDRLRAQQNNTGQP
jgi:hypothetical protein